MTPPKRRAGARRALRSRTLPQWLRHGQTNHPIARARCLLLLRVLSGAEPLTQAIRTAKISRPTYYWLERKGLRGMLTALTPMAPQERPSRMSAAAAQVAALEQKVQRLEQAKRRAERLLMVTRTVRAFDAMQVATTHGRRHLLIASDGAIPYRTSCVAVRRYTGRAVAQVLTADFARHGAPLVCRLDRARQHATAAVRAVLRRHGVLRLHGPPHCPRFYGQLERQNREHRQWLKTLDVPRPTGLATLGDELRSVCNARWRRRTLGWRTAEEAWNDRAALTENRAAFRRDVQHRAARVRRHLAQRGKPAGLPERLAIEQALITRGYLRRVSGGWC